jgi:O-antigen ligase
MVGTGIVSWARALYARSRGDDVPHLPGRRLLLALHLVVLLQLLPLPAGAVKMVSPGSYTFHAAQPGGAERAWMTITASPPLTRRGLMFVFGMTLLYGTVFREFREHRWRRRLGWALVVAGSTATVVGLVQMASPNPTTIYGRWRPQFDRAVFGPYVNRSHYGGYMAMVIPIAAALTAEAGGRLRRSRPARWWLALGQPAANSFLIRLSFAVLVTVGPFVTTSRAAMVAAVVGLLVFAVAGSRRSVGAGILVILGLVTLTAVWVDWDRAAAVFEGRNPGSDRLALWRDQSRLVPDFPLFGVGFNALGVVYPRYQTYERYAGWPQTHNEYLQALTDTGVSGAAILYALLFLLFRTAWRASRHSLFSAGVFVALVASATTNLVDFNWQIPANCATFVALAGLAMSAGLDLDPAEPPP